MLAPANGNMSEVYAEFWRMQEITESVEMAINYVVSQSAPTEAEVSDEYPAHWYLVHTYPGDDVKAMRWLARRKFGAFRAMRQKRNKRNDEMRYQGWEPSFPGWVFVYTWDIQKMLRRILSLPGVMGILSDPVSHKPQPIPDWFVTKLQSDSWDYRDHAPAAPRRSHWSVVADRNTHRQKKRRKRPGKRIKKGYSQPILTESGSGVT